MIRQGYAYLDLDNFQDATKLLQKIDDLGDAGDLAESIEQFRERVKVEETIQRQCPLDFHEREKAKKYQAWAE